MFLHTMGNNTAYQYKLNTVSIREDWSYDRNLQHIFGDFVTSECRRIGNYRNNQQDSSNAVSDNKKKKDNNKDNKDSNNDSNQKKQYESFWCKKKLGYKPVECSLNPKNKKDAKPASAATASTTNL